MSTNLLLTYESFTSTDKTGAEPTFKNFGRELAEYISMVGENASKPINPNQIPPTYIHREKTYYFTVPVAIGDAMIDAGDIDFTSSDGVVSLKLTPKLSSESYGRAKLEDTKFWGFINVENSSTPITPDELARVMGPAFLKAGLKLHPDAINGGIAFATRTDNRTGTKEAIRGRYNISYLNTTSPDGYLHIEELPTYLIRVPIKDTFASYELNHNLAGGYGICIKCLRAVPHRCVCGSTSSNKRSAPSSSSNQMNAQQRMRAKMLANNPHLKPK